MVSQLPGRKPSKEVLQLARQKPEDSSSQKLQKHILLTRQHLYIRPLLHLADLDKIGMIPRRSRTGMQ